MRKTNPLYLRTQRLIAETQRDTQRHIQRHRETHAETQTETHRHTDIDTHKETHKSCLKGLPFVLLHTSIKSLHLKHFI